MDIEEGINSQRMESRITKNMSHPRAGALTASAQRDFRIAVDQRLLCFSNYSSYVVEMFFGYSASFHYCIVCVCVSVCVCLCACARMEGVMAVVVANTSSC